MKGRRIDSLIILLAAIPSIVFLFQLIQPESAFFTKMLPKQSLVGTAGIIKMTFLLGGSLFALKNTLQFEAGNPIRPAWLLFFFGLHYTFIGQACLAPYQIFGSGEAPNPSLGDLFFVAGYPFFFFGLIRIMKAYKEVGYPVSPASQRIIAVSIMSLISVVALYLLLKPVWSTDKDVLVKVVASAYPILDFVLLILVVMVVRMTLPLREGKVGKSWLVLLAGFLFMGAGDIIFAYTAILDLKNLDPLVHITYLFTYGFLAIGVYRQYKLLSS